MLLSVLNQCRSRKESLACYHTVGIQSIEAIEVTKKGLNVNGESINNIRYATDTILKADNLWGLQTLKNKVTQSSELNERHLNIKKTKHKVISKSKKTTLATKGK